MNKEVINNILWILLITFKIIKNNDAIGSLIQYFKNINLYDKYLLDFNILLKNDIISNNYEYVLLLNIIGYYGHI